MADELKCECGKIGKSVAGFSVHQKHCKTHLDLMETQPKAEDVPVERPSVAENLVKFEKEEQEQNEVAQMIPKKWRAIVDEKLGKDFDLKVEDSSDGNFVLHFILPQRIDRRVGDRTGRDHSVGLIRRASATGDVEQWADRIAGNIKKTFTHFSPNKETVKA